MLLSACSLLLSGALAAHPHLRHVTLGDHDGVAESSSFHLTAPLSNSRLVRRQQLYVTNDGYLTNSITAATIFVIANNMLYGNGQIISADPTDINVPLAPISPPRNVTLSWSIVNNVPTWQNSAWANGSASLCKGTENRVYLVLQYGPPGCVPVVANAILPVPPSPVSSSLSSASASSTASASSPASSSSTLSSFSLTSSMSAASVTSPSMTSSSMTSSSMTSSSVASSTANPTSTTGGINVIIGGATIISTTSLATVTVPTFTPLTTLLPTFTTLPTLLPSSGISNTVPSVTVSVPSSITVPTISTTPIVTETVPTLTLPLVTATTMSSSVTG